MRSKRFKPVVDHAHHIEQEAAKALGHAQQHLAGQSERLNQLKTYRQEYIDRYQEIGRNGLAPERLRDYQAFMAKLSDAVVQQTQTVDDADKKLGGLRQFWLSKKGRSQALDKVINRYAQEEHDDEIKKEQREIDDRRRPIN